MASGREDYTTGLSPLKQSTSLDQVYWVEKKEKQIVAGATNGMIAYVVPAGYKLIITGGLVTCSNPGRQTFYVHLGVSLWGYIYYDTNYLLPYDPSGIYEMAAGETAYLYCRNDDDQTALMYCVLHGFLEKVK